MVCKALETAEDLCARSQDSFVSVSEWGYVSFLVYDTHCNRALSCGKTGSFSRPLGHQRKNVNMNSIYE